MPGSTFIVTETVADLYQLAKDLYYLDKLRHISLDQLTTIDFEMAIRDLGIKWAQGNPIAFDPERGLAIFKITPAALEQLALPQTKLEATSIEDISALRSFAIKNGIKNIYELVTF